MEKVREFPIEFDDETNLGDYEAYVELKKRINVEPNYQLTSESGAHISRLINEFITELPHRFLEDEIKRLLLITVNASKCK